ncbi:MAG: hypothetical protein K6G68_03155 [Oscillospiraceae bacterium]|nr:hypothetical protein [Oscillospiraceae bacterium]
MAGWRSLKEYPQDIQDRTIGELAGYNRKYLITYILFGIFVGSATIAVLNLKQPAVLVSIIIALLFIVLMTLLYQLQKKPTDADSIFIREDTVSVYRPAAMSMKRYKAPRVITDDGIKAFIYNGRKYIRGDRVFIIKCGKTPEDIICMSFDSSDRKE